MKLKLLEELDEEMGGSEPRRNVWIAGMDRGGDPEEFFSGIGLVHLVYLQL